ncbi:MAG: twin-arginine translocase subunit TatC [Actinomycetales bacterium]
MADERSTRARGSHRAASPKASTRRAATKRAKKKKASRDPEGRMPLREHLVELRNRIFKAGIGLLLGAVAGWFLYDPVLSGLSRPIQEVAAEAGREASINFGAVASPFDLKLRVAAFIGIIVSSPVWIYQIWAFVTPGLTRRERGYALGFFFVSIPLFLSGAYLAYRAMPNFVRFLVSFSPEGFSNFIDAQVYLGFVMRLIISFGLSFLFPVLLVGMNFIGVVSGRAMLKAWRWVVVVAFGFAAIATPTPDVMSMFLLAAPLLGLFFLAIGIAMLNDRRRRRRDPDQAALAEIADLSDDAASTL